jgi:hypothetical protein
MTNPTPAALDGLIGLKANEIFVFGSNLAGRHGAGSAKHANRYYGAERGVGEGRTGNAYAIPTKDAALKTLPLERIALHVAKFKGYAALHPELTFKLVAIGCGLAGYTPEQIAPMFANAPANVIKPPEFLRALRAGEGAE